MGLEWDAAWCSVKHWALQIQEPQWLRGNSIRVELGQGFCGEPVKASSGKLAQICCGDRCLCLHSGPLLGFLEAPEKVLDSEHQGPE